RPRSGLPVPVGGILRRNRDARLLVDDDLPRRAHRRLHLRMEEGSAGMGLTPARTRETGMVVAGGGTLVAPRPTGVLDPRTGKPVGADDPFFADINSELSDKGFL